MTSRVPLGVWLLTMAMIAVGLTLIAVVPGGRTPEGANLGDALPVLPQPLTAAACWRADLLAAPGNRVGMLLSLIGLITATQYLAAGYSIFGSFSDHRLPFTDIAAWFFSWGGAAVGFCADLILFTFPERPLDLRSTRLGIACAVGGSLAFLIALAIVPAGCSTSPGSRTPSAGRAQSRRSSCCLGPRLPSSLPRSSSPPAASWSATRRRTGANAFS
jgi:hypothetical protein